MQATRRGRDDQLLRQHKCRAKGCSKITIIGITKKKTSGSCKQYAPDRMAAVKKRECTTQGCCKRPVFGVAGTRMTEYCAQHALDGMVNVNRRKCRTEGCG
ncbi:unnamed protein product, partial [Ascophyllum nodosum]